MRAETGKGLQDRVASGPDCGLPGRDPSCPYVCRAQIGFWWCRGVLGCRITWDRPRLSKFIVRAIIRLLIREYVKGALSHELVVAEWHFLASYMALNHCSRADSAADNLSESVITIEGRCFLTSYWTGWGFCDSNFPSVELTVQWSRGYFFQSHFKQWSLIRLKW